MTSNPESVVAVARLRVLVVDDHRTFSDLLAMALDAESDLSCVGRAFTGEQALLLDEQDEPDVVVMDVRLSGMDGIATTEAIMQRSPNRRVVVLTAIPSPALLTSALAAGAQALLTKGGPIEDLFGAIRAPRNGPNLVSNFATSQWESGSSGPSVKFTPREQLVLELLDQGLDSTAIARQLGISVHTARGYVKTLLHKLQSHSQLQAVAKARRLGLFSDVGQS